MSILFYCLTVKKQIHNWVSQQIADTEEAVVIHIGCGMDSRVLRVGTMNHKWYDVDFPEVIEERKRYYTESADYK